ncbi:165_t:CDS:2 [Paraglomus brasilianum]|uniref:165_t:CDS:1 n=1 Tax=Paraglomus brasilianum TaxID=144538 RepID=A0A9N8ZYW1_9GLOM|nr:165_t:CDS:2 [Paraglomus brasilianum]
MTESAPDITKQITEIVVVGDDDKTAKLNTDEYCRKLDIGGQKVVVVKHETEIVSGGVHNYCVQGSPEHVAALKVKVDELKEYSARLERERAEAVSRSESVTGELDRLVAELKQLGHADADSEQTIHATVHTFGRLQKLEIIADDEDRDYLRLIRKPRVRQYWHDGALHREAEERSMSYTELFWDLIFVGVVRIIGHTLVSDVNSASLKHYFLTFYPLWRLWTDVHTYLNVYSSDDLVQKFVLLWEGAIAVGMATHSEKVDGNVGQFYIISYIIGRLTFATLYLNFARFIPMFRVSFIANVWGIVIPCIFWVIAAVVPNKVTSSLVWAAIAFEVFWNGFIPIYNRYGTKHPANHTHTADFERVVTITESEKDGTVTESEKDDTITDEGREEKLQGIALTPHLSMRTKGTEYQWKWTDWFSLFEIAKYRPALNIEHWSERVGSFAVICLGEMVISILYTSFNTIPDGIFGKAVLGLLFAYNLHWIYFDVDASRQYQHALRRHVITGLCFGLIHLPLNMALIAAGVALSAIVQARDFPGAHSIPDGELTDSSSDLSSHLNTDSALAYATSDVGGASAMPKELIWLFCVSSGIILYCMAAIGMLHKGLDTVDSLRIPKAYRISLRLIIGTIYILLPLCNLNSLDLVITVSVLSLFLVIIETYGRLHRNEPIFFDCDQDIIGDSATMTRAKYIRWRWGPLKKNQRRWSRGVLRQRKDKKDNVEDVVEDENLNGDMTVVGDGR